MSKKYLGAKPLKGLTSLEPRIADQLEDTIVTTITEGGINFNNVIITSGTIDGVTIGGTEPGPGTFTNLEIGGSDGNGQDACFYSDIVGTYMCWESNIGLLDVRASIDVRDISDLGNIRIFGNTITTTNLNGNINLDPNGGGIVNITAPLNVSTTDGGVNYNISENFIVNSLGFNTITDNEQQYISHNGDIDITAGDTNVITTITNISIGNPSTITTSSNHYLNSGDIITISGSNSTPSIDGEYTISSILNNTQFQLSTPVAIAGNTGTFTRRVDLNLCAKNSINICQEIPLTFAGDNTSIVGDAGSNLILSSSGDISLNASGDINIPTSVGLTFSNDNFKIESDGTDLVINTLNKVRIGGDLIIDGTTTTVNSTVVTIDDPVLTLGGDTAPLLDDGVDKGIEFRWHDGISSKLGFFGFDRSTECFIFIPDAIEAGGQYSGTLGCANFSSLEVSSSISTPAVETCSITCSGTLQLNADTSIELNTPYIKIQDDSYLQFGTASSPNTIIYKETAPNCNLVLQSECGIELTPASGNNIFIPNDISILFGTSNNASIYGTSSGELVLSGTPVNLNTNIFNLGIDSNDSQDRGIFITYNDGSTKNAFFGFDESSGCFVYFNEAINTSGVISGTKGCVDVGEINLNNGDLINVSNISSSNSNNLTIQAGTGADINLSTDTNQNINIPPNVDLTFNGENAKIYSDGTDLCIQVADPGIICLDQDTVIQGDLTVNGNIVTTTPISTVFTVERFSVAGGASQSPDSGSNVTFISVTGTGTATGTIALPIGADGFLKNISISALASGTTYELTFPAGALIDPGSGTTIAKKAIFTCPGQGIFMVFDDVISAFVIINGGAEIIAL